MSSTVAVDTTPAWTWADLVSTYRFWALLGFYVLASTSFFLYSTFLPLLRDSQNLPLSEFGTILGVRTFSGFFALYFAWLATRWRPVAMLFLMGVFQLAGTALLVIPSLSTSFAIRSVGAISSGLGYFTMLLAIPAFLAAGLGGSRSFVLAFGIILMFSRLIQTLIPLVSIQVVNAENLATAVVAPLLLAVLLLLSVKRTLFQDPPPPRGRSFQAAPREPVAVAFLCLVPFYLLYWFYKVHGEVASLGRSNALLSPRGAVGVAFIPLMIPAMLTTLIDELNIRGTGLGIRGFRSSWAVFLWSVVVPPVGVALVQSAMNQLIARSDRLGNRE